MKDRILKLLNVFIWAMILICIADTIYRIWEHVKYPELAEVLSSPWYTDIIFFGIVTAVIVGFCLLFRWIIRKRDD